MARLALGHELRANVLLSNGGLSHAHAYFANLQRALDLTVTVLFSPAFDRLITLSWHLRSESTWNLC